MDTGGAAQCSVVDGGFSRYNEATARHCVALARAARDGGVASVAVITPYVEQARRIRRLLNGVDGVECQTVHRFQGSERDLVVLDTVDAEPHRPGVLLAGSGPGAQAANLLNVAVSRARGKLIIVADREYFQARASASALTALLDACVKVGQCHGFPDEPSRP